MIDRILTPLRSIRRDLIDKRLWPVALVLVLALVAVPVFIGSSASDAPPTAPIVPAATPATGGGGSPITVENAAVIGRGRPGAVHDPFFNPPKPKTTSSVPTSTSTSTTTSTTTPPPTTSATHTTPSKTSPATPAATPPATSTVTSLVERTVFRTRLSWGEAPGTEVRGVSRLEPLGGLSNPGVVYLGTTADGSRAVFLLGPQALSIGEEECGEKTCRVFALKPGAETAVSVQGEDGQLHVFTLKIDSIKSRVVASRSQAAELRARVHPDGRDVLRAIIKDAKTAAAIGQFTYDLSLGAVVALAAP
jgi:hypothetical protein